MRLIDKVFRLEELKGLNDCPTYMYRWSLFASKWFCIYLHHFVADDFSRDLHDHPKRFISIGLKGSYIEETPKGKEVFKAPWIRSFPAEYIHRVSPVGKGCWTLVIVFKATREWGFWHFGKWIHWQEYNDNKEIAEKMKSC